ncbi:3-isopropylmalate dehydratase large subunit [Cohaesibacter gelatinilyticus]|uniref:3-isopropylmalate dehydratase n=1 Tax=Cohaesibacter gelatinilyticus TaxID=372072 RepID=A0A285PCR5_9HYPH|nr:3-isopropylmalate dehydratase large subunit [Cohaesibacter gelatinilyticus]SNZ19534.1 3-isopropylmalate dehydratase, large subunit [Cohaesibacter gelatinilyticus]
MSRTLYDKLVDAHKVCDLPDGDMLIYVDFHIMNEYTSPQAFSGLDTKQLSVWRPEAHLAVVDHVNATRSREPHDAASKLLIDNLEANCTKHGIAFYGLGDRRQGIEHVVVPEQGLVVPGMLIACGDSHTTTYGAYGALGFGIGTSEVEHVLATQTLRYKRLKTMLVEIEGDLATGVTAKDIIMKVVQVIGAGGANGYAVEFAGSAIRAQSMSGRMTICNMAVELGGRAALIAADDKAFRMAAGRPHSEMLHFDGEEWVSDPGAEFDTLVRIDAGEIAPLVSWGTSPDQSVSITGHVPHASSLFTPKAKAALERALDYMGLTAGQSVQDIPIDGAFIGSCTNSRIEDLRDAALVLKGRKVAKGVNAIVVPGSALTRLQAEAEGLDTVFIEAGFDWRPESGCSMCLAMNDDIAMDGERIASSTNRNFEGRQGRGARTHLMSPAMVAAAAVAGHLTDVRNCQLEAN